MTDSLRGTKNQLREDKDDFNSIVERSLESGEKFKLGLTESIYKRFKEVEVKLMILSLQHQEISTRHDTLRSFMSRPEFQTVQATLSQLPRYFVKLKKMRARMRQVELKVAGFPKRQVEVIKQRHRITAIKQWREGELNARLQATENTASIQQLKVKFHRPIQFDNDPSPFQSNSRDLPSHSLPDVTSPVHPTSTPSSSTRHTPKPSPPSSISSTQRPSNPSSPPSSIHTTITTTTLPKSRKPKSSKGKKKPKEIAPQFASLLSNLNTQPDPDP